MKAPKINIPDKITLPDGRTLTRKVIYNGKLLEKTPKLEAELEPIRREIAYLEMEMFNMEKVHRMFITDKDAKQRLFDKMSSISHTIQVLKSKMQKIKREFRDAQ